MLPGIALCLSHQPMSHGSRIPVHCHQDVSPRWSVNQRQLFFFTWRQVVSGLEFLQILAFPPVHCQRYSLPSVIRCHNKCEEVTALSVSAPGGVRGGAYTHTSSLVVDGTGSPGYLGQRDITLSGFPTDWIPSLRPLGSALVYNRQMPPPPLLRILTLYHWIHYGSFNHAGALFLRSPWYKYPKNNAPVVPHMCA